MSKLTTKKPKKSAIELDDEISEEGMGFTSPRMKRSQSRAKKAAKEEKVITEKKSKSLARGVKGYVMGSNYMDAKDLEERAEREKKRNIQNKAEEAGIRGSLRALKAKGELRG